MCCVRNKNCSNIRDTFLSICFFQIELNLYSYLSHSVFYTWTPFAFQFDIEFWSFDSSLSIARTNKRTNEGTSTCIQKSNSPGIVAAADWSRGIRRCHPGKEGGEGERARGERGQRSWLLPPFLHDFSSVEEASWGKRGRVHLKIPEPSRRCARRSINAHVPRDFDREFGYPRRYK